MIGIDVQDQAERFLSWFSRLRGTSIKPAFETWARSKDFSPEDTTCIWGAVEEEIVGLQDPEEITVADREMLLESYCENPACQVRNFHFYIKPTDRRETVRAKKLFCPVCGLQASHWVKPSVYDNPPSSLIASGSERRTIHD